TLPASAEPGGSPDKTASERRGSVGETWFPPRERGRAGRQCRRAKPGGTPQPWGERRSRCQVVRVVGQVLRAVRCDEAEVLEPEDVAALDAGADRLERPVERLLAETVELEHLVRGLTHDVGPRHVGVARGFGVLRPEVDHDRLPP